MSHVYQCKITINIEIVLTLLGVKTIATKANNNVRPVLRKPLTIKHDNHKCRLQTTCVSSRQFKLKWFWSYFFVIRENTRLKHRCPYMWKYLSWVKSWQVASLGIIQLYGPRQANLVLIAYASSEGSGEPAHPRSLARTTAACSYKQWVKRNLQTESQIPSCAIKICNDGMLEDTNSLDGAHTI